MPLVLEACVLEAEVFKEFGFDEAHAQYPSSLALT
jgi:hypothetical protein